MITVAYGKNIAEITYKTLAASDIFEYLKPHFCVAIKPNLVVPGPASNGATTHPEVVEGILRFLFEFGISAQKVSIIESSWIGADTRDAFRDCGFESLRKKFGVELFDLKQDACEKKIFKHLKMKNRDENFFDELEIEIYKRALETDFLINVPVLKAHCQTKMTCCMKNLKGCIPDREKRRFHALGLHKPIAALNALVPTGYCVVDGICGDLTFEEGGNPTYANRIIVGRDAVEVDSYCAELIGYDPHEIEYLQLARRAGRENFFSHEKNEKINREHENFFSHEKNEKINRAQKNFSSYKVTEIFAEEKPINSIKASRVAARYEKNICEDAACSACYAALIHALHRIGGSNKNFCIGQGFRNRAEKNKIGVGNCTKNFCENISGCPPAATEIIKMLTSVFVM
ncbi:MAG: DUF362 domain-containing protein [Defluviitaleaceae bacterium]|nr:DUF362 domain-containing protein [Defluviitaleaceae bacterium]